MKIKRLLKGSERGADVRMVQRALNAAPSRTAIAVTSIYDETTQRRVTRFRVANSLNPGKQFDQEALDALWPYFDAYGRWRYRLYIPPRPARVEPKQGWGSLDRSLWDLYSLGRSKPYSFADLGTYNPASRLPSGRPSDHAVYPALAFDLGISPAVGWQNLRARDYFNICTKRDEVEYVILGDRIWSRSSGLHSYTGGGHQNHVHVSGRGL